MYKSQFLNKKLYVKEMEGDSQSFNFYYKLKLKTAVNGSNYFYCRSRNKQKFEKRVKIFSGSLRRKKEKEFEQIKKDFIYRYCDVVNSIEKIKIENYLEIGIII